MPPELTDAEQKFFATGELSPELAASVDNSAPAADPSASGGSGEAPPAPTAAPDPSVAPAPAAPPPVAVSPDLERMLADERTRFAQLNAKIEQLQQGLAPKPAAPVAPDPVVDPLGAMMHELRAVNEKVADLQGKLQAQQQLEGQQRQFQEFASKIGQAKADFMKSAPDFGDAYQFLRAARTSDLRDVGVPEDKIAEALLQDEMAVASTAFERGKNPAEVIYGMAKRYGYQAKAGAPAPAAGKLQTLQQGQEAATNLQKGAPAAGPMTLESLKDASSSDLDAVVQSDEQWMKVVGQRSNNIF